MGVKTASCTLGQLASIDIPNESDIEYYQMMVKAIFSFDQMFWWYMMNQNYQINGFNTGFILPLIIEESDVPEGGDDEMNNICSNNMINEPLRKWAEIDTDFKVCNYHTVKENQMVI